MALHSSRRSNDLAEKFAEANEHWNLDKLYRDIAVAKQQERRRQCKQLTPTEKACLRGLLCGYSPTEIATQLNREPNGLRVELSRGLYRYIETSTDACIKGWNNISKLLENAGYKHQQNFQKAEVRRQRAEGTHVFKRGIEARTLCRNALCVSIQFFV